MSKRAAVVAYIYLVGCILFSIGMGIESESVGGTLIPLGLGLALPATFWVIGNIKEF